MAARMDKEEDGSSFVRLQIAITDPVAVQKVMDKRYLTGSVGGRAGKAVCSISGDDLANLDESGKPKMARFKRGQIYKGKLAFIDMQDISFKEYSFVNQPADSKSSVRSVAAPGSNAVGTTDSEWVARSSAFVLSMDKEDIFSVEENESLFANLKTKESRPLYLHLKGAFLSAMAIQENENYINANNSLLSSENDTKDIHEENLNMNENVKDKDILATVEELSQDLSTLSNTKVEESQDPETAETPEEEAEEVEESEKVIQEAEGDPLAVALQKVLNDTIVFYFAAHRAHWNVEGEDFTEYHELFSNIYEDAINAVDPLAENMRKIQAFPGTLTEAVMNSSFKDDLVITEALGLASGILEKNNAVNASVMAAFAAANTANEQGVANFLAERDDQHKKWAWQLRSSLKMDAQDAAESAWREENKSTEIVEKAEVPTEEVVDSANSAIEEETQAIEESNANLTDEKVVSEQDVDDSSKKLQELEEENKKLKSAMHRTLVERVVDTKIATGIESHELREELIGEHLTRSATSLADSLRDLAKLPMAKSAKGPMPEINSELTVIEGEDNVYTLDKQEDIIEEDQEKTPEQLFVDALMGRRKL
jgi:starvation-inducible DNA-binding protein